MSRLPRFPVEGRCLCGAASYALAASPLAVYACHCRDCQRFASGPYAVGIIVNRKDMVFPQPAALASTQRRGDSGRIVRQFACAQCGTRLWHEADHAPDTIILRAGTLDEPGWARPAVHSWTRSRLPWVDLGDEPQFAGAVPSRDVLYDAWRAWLDAGET